MPIDPNIALSFRGMQVADPLAQYGQVQNILAAQSQRQAAGTSNELAQVQLGQARMTLRQAQEAQDTVAKIMGTVGQHGGPADPMEAAMLMLKDPRRQVQDAGGHLLDSFKKVQEYRQQSQFMQDQEPSAVTGPTGTNLAPITPETAFTAPVSRGTPNALAPAAAPQVNALAAPQGKTAESLATKINEGDRKYGTAPGWLKQRELLVKEFDQLIKPEFEFKEVQNADGTISYQALNKRTAQAQPVMGGGVGVNVAAQRLKFEQDKFAWEQANPGKEIKEITNADGTVSVLGIDKRTGVATPVTMGTGNVTGVNTTAQRLQYEKDNPGKTIQQVTKADGSVNFVAVDNRTGIATPVTMGADAQATPATVAGQPLVGAKVNAPPSMVAEYTFAKTADGGNFKGSYQDFVTARAKAGRAPVQPVAPTITTVEDPNNPGKFLQVDARTYKGGGAGSAGVIGGARPSATAEKTTAQRAQMGKDLGFAITQLGDITKDGGLIDQSTGSGAGQLVDMGAGFFGKATKGAIAIGKIAPVADLVLKMVPRFEGPQSNADTKSYKEAAGQLADASLPTKIRKEAGKTILRIMKERKNQFVTTDMAAEGTGADTTEGAVDTSNPLLKGK